ncbi:MAG TPA: UvrD-helicase domain-containing protein [Rectinemataceae bacterium]|nr:UvrD-helicase domain-containing protein [Rectinemataceae bacterium]
MRDQWARGLNPEQLEAVETIEGPLLIIAGAGSGKTRVITYRIAHMLDEGIPQHAILALTFTNKAAREMAERVRAITGKKLQGLTVSTFHSFGVQILRKEIHRLGFRDNFSIYDEADRNQLIKDCARDLGFRMESFDAWKVGALFSEISTGIRDWSKADDSYRGLYDDYRKSLRIFNAVDFDDLIGLPIDIFDLHPEVAAEWRERYRYVMIDEFQDTSLQQYKMMRHIAARNVCVVGDDDQSIYSWRGANYENIVRFEEDFPERKEVKLERNYRSTSTILDAANAIIANNDNRKEKALWSPDGPGGRPIELYTPADEAEEADFIARTIKEIKFEEHRPWEDFGILIRTNNLARRMEESLLAANVPYRISGGTSFFGRKEIKDIISYLRVLANPDDDINLLRVINTPRRGIGKATIEKVGAVAKARSCSMRTALELARSGEFLAAEGGASSPSMPAVTAGTDLFGEATDGARAGFFAGLSEKAVADIGIFLDLLDEWREELLGKKRIAERVRKLVDAVDYWGYLIEENRHNDKAAKWKFHNVETFINMIKTWEEDPDTLDPGLFAWLNRITLVTRDDDESEGDGKVNLMTIHAAKGLEFEVVFIAGCEDGIIPHARSLEEGGQLDEERRLFYVAVTRARKRLLVTSCTRRRRLKETVEALPSPFLAEIPAHLLLACEMSNETTEEQGEAFFGKMAGMFPKEDQSG